MDVNAKAPEASSSFREERGSSGTNYSGSIKDIEEGYKSPGKEVEQDGGALEKHETNRSRRTLRSTAPTTDNISSIPNGGAVAWLQVVGVFFCFFNDWGLVNCFGVYQTAYETDILRTSSPAAISWIGSVQSAILTLLGPLSGPLYDAGYFKALILTGSFCVVFGQMMLSLCTEYWQVFLTQGIIVGIGAGLLMVPSVAILSTYFTTRLATATGLAAAGSSIGGVVYSVALYRLLPTVGFAWATRILGFVSLGTLIIANMSFKVRAVPPMKRKIFDWAAFKEAPYTLFVVGCGLSLLGLYTPFFYVELYSLTYNIASRALSFYTLAIINAGSVFGRILPNMLADKIGPLNVIVPATVISGVITLCLIPVRTVGPLLALCALYGFFTGALVSLPPTVYVYLSLNKRHLIGTRIGMGMFVTSGALLIGAPATGWILDAGGFTYIWVFAGLLLVIGGLIQGTGRLAKTGLVLKAKT